VAENLVQTHARSDQSTSQCRKSSARSSCLAVGAETRGSLVSITAPSHEEADSVDVCALGLLAVVPVPCAFGNLVEQTAGGGGVWGLTELTPGRCIRASLRLIAD
jgi:hypothetical protein